MARRQGDSVTLVNVEKEPDTVASISADEIGVLGGLTFGGFLSGETVNVIPVSYAELRRMTDEDGQAKALLQLMTLPIMAAKWDVFDAEEDADRGRVGTTSLGVKSSDERDFISEILFKPMPEGGMSIPFETVIATMSLAVRDGFKLFEKVWKLDDRGRVVLKKLAPRANDTVSLLVDDHGDFNGARQRTFFKGQYIDVTIEKEKSLLYVHGKEDNPLYGSPVFLPIYYHYNKKHKLYYISHIAFQMLAIPTRVGTVPAGTSKEVRDAFLAALGSLGFKAAMNMPEGFSVEKFESTRSLADFMPLIDHHNVQMSKAVLGQFIDLEKSATGKLSAEQMDIFVLSLVSILNNIENVFNNWVIPQANSFNFSSKRFPKLRARPFTDKDKEVLTDIFKEIMTAGTEKVTPEFLLRLEKRMASQLNIKDINYAKIEPRVLKEHADRQAVDRERMNALTKARSAGNPNSSGRQNAPGDGTGKEGNQ